MRPGKPQTDSSRPEISGVQSAGLIRVFRSLDDRTAVGEQGELESVYLRAQQECVVSDGDGGDAGQFFRKGGKVHGLITVKVDLDGVSSAEPRGGAADLAPQVGEFAAFAAWTIALVQGALHGEIHDAAGPHIDADEVPIDLG